VFYALGRFYEIFIDSSPSTAQTQKNFHESFKKIGSDKKKKKKKRKKKKKKKEPLLTICSFLFRISILSNYLLKFKRIQIDNCERPLMKLT
jgi:hypothetical protein